MGVLIAAVLYMLSVLDATRENFSGFNLSFAVFLATVIPAIIFLARGCFEKSILQFRQLFVIIGVSFLIVSILALIGGIALPTSNIIPILAVVLALGIFTMVVAKGNRRWDTGHNQEPNYKNYNERKAEENSQNAKVDNENHPTQDLL